MTDRDEPSSREDAQAQSPGAAALSAAARHAQHAVESAKGLAAQAHLDEVGAKAAAAASNSTGKAATGSPATMNWLRRPSN